MDKTICDVYFACVQAIKQGKMISRVSNTDKEFSFQNWFGDRLIELGIEFEKPSRNTYPDFCLKKLSLGFEIKGLAIPGREASYDCNSQVPSGKHNGRKIYYVFGRYPAKSNSHLYPVIDLIICDGNFLNSDNEYIHANKNLKGFGSYGDLMIRDRKMYVAPTPFALTRGTTNQITLITSADFSGSKDLTLVGKVCQTNSEHIITNYSFDLTKNQLSINYAPNPHAGQTQCFHAFRSHAMKIPGSG